MSSTLMSRARAYERELNRTVVDWATREEMHFQVWELNNDYQTNDDNGVDDYGISGDALARALRGDADE